MGIGHHYEPEMKPRGTGPFTGCHATPVMSR